MRNVFSANVVLWIVQGFLALFFGLASGAPKFFLTPDMLNMPILLPDAFVKFIGTAEVNASTAKMRLVQITEEIISILAGDSHATVKVSVEITADFPEGVSDHIKRAISENASSLGFKNKTWE